MLTQIPTKNMPQEEWLAHRRNAIGGSDAAAIIGLNEYSSPMTIWLDKMGKLPAKEENEAMRLGHDLEDYVAHRFMEATGKKVRKRNAIIYNDKYPFAHANIDREVIGESAILECKTTSALALKKFKNGNYPQNYYVQVMHYMAVTGAKKAYIAVLVLQKDFYWFEVERDEDEIRALMNAEETFWNFVQKKEEPPAISIDMEALKDAHPQSNGITVDLFGKDDKMERYLELKEQAKVLEKEMDSIEVELKQAIGDNEAGKGEHYTATWKTQTSNRFDKEALAAAYPKINLSPFYKPSTCRKFTVKKNKN